MDELLQASLPENKFDVVQVLAVAVVVGGGAPPATVPLTDALPMAIADAANAVATHQVRPKNLKIIGSCVRICVMCMLCVCLNLYRLWVSYVCE
jgi:hypothetical protein